MRSNDFLPQKTDAAFSSDVSFNVPGLFQFSGLIYKYIKSVKEKFNYDVPIKYIYGAPHVKWNGGRLILNHELQQINVHEMIIEIKEAISHKLIPLVTFSNMQITVDDLGDANCNAILDVLNEVGGGVIVSSDLLYHYITTQYTNVEIHASVIMTAFCARRSAAYYKKLSQKFNYYVVNPDDMFKPNLVSNIPTKNAEILINERCFRECKSRSEHYQSISREQLLQADKSYIDEKFLQGCAAIPEWKQCNTKMRNISLSCDEVRDWIGQGFRNIKLQGRTDNLFVFFFDLMRYTLENSIAFPAMYPIFSFEIQKHLYGDTLNGKYSII